jgi:riboflavin biosynthesis pyrimidine reductase
MHDAVLLSNGHLEEAVFNGHGQDVFSLPTNTPPEVSDLLASLVSGGVRSLLVDGISPLTSSFLESDLIDQTVAYVDSNGPSNLRQTSNNIQRFTGLISNFALRNVTRVGPMIRAHSVHRR